MEGSAGSRPKGNPPFPPPAVSVSDITMGQNSEGKEKEGEQKGEVPPAAGHQPDGSETHAWDGAAVSVRCANRGKGSCTGKGWSEWEACLQGSFFFDKYEHEH